MSDYEVHLGDEGTIVKITIKEQAVAIPLAEATAILIKLERKDRTTFEVDGLIWGDPDDGIVYFVSESTTFDLKGEWTIQVDITYPTGHWHTSKETFTVSDNIVVEEA